MPDNGRTTRAGIFRDDQELFHQIIHNNVHCTILYYQSWWMEGLEAECTNSWCTSVHLPVWRATSPQMEWPTNKNTESNMIASQPNLPTASQSLSYYLLMPQAISFSESWWKCRHKQIGNHLVTPLLTFLFAGETPRPDSTITNGMLTHFLPLRPFWKIFIKVG